jgi:UDP-3-O-[3-hydroxymyristoyl] glucosamine N-acyltransferase
VLPAIDAAAWRRTVALLRRLDRLAERVRSLEQRLTEQERSR